MAEMYQMEAEQVASMIPEKEKENTKKDLAVNKAIDFILENANQVEASEELEFEE